MTCKHWEIGHRCMRPMGTALPVCCFKLLLASFGKDIAAQSYSFCSFVKLLFTQSMARTEMLKHKCFLVLVLFHVFSIQQSTIQKITQYGEKILSSLSFISIILPPENTSDSTGANKNTLVSYCR